MNRPEYRRPHAFARTRLAICLGAALSISAGAAGIDARPQDSALAAARSHLLHERPHVGPAPEKLAKVRSTVATPDRPATTLEVTNCDDDGNGSLRATIDASVSGDTIDLTQLTCSTITLTSGAIFFGTDITLQGPGSANLTVTAGYTSGILQHLGSGTLQVDGLHLMQGYYLSDSFPYGGCVYSEGSVFLYDTAISNCFAVGTGTHETRGGGVYARDNMSMMFSSVTGSIAYALGSTDALGGGVYAGGNLFAKYSTISNNQAYAPSSRGYAGGAWVLGTAYLGFSTVALNTAQQTGGLLLFGDGTANGLDIKESTIYGNYASSSRYGAGIFAFSAITITNSTITGNVAANATNSKYGAGLRLYDYANATLQSTIIANNFLRTSTGLLGDDLNGGTGANVTGANNLIMLPLLAVPADTISSDPMLQYMTYNGGLTQTLAPSEGSPVIDTGNNVAGDSNDQRGPGFARQLGSAPDIGAVEFLPIVLVAPTVVKAFSPDTISADGVSTLTITLANSNASGATLTAALTDTLPSPVVVAASPNASTTCPGGSVTADPGTGSVSIAAAAQIPAAGSCTISVDVTAASAGVFTNTIAAGDLQTNEGNNVDPTTADLTVSALPIAPSVSKVFSPANIATNGVSTLTIVLSNSNAGPATLSAALTDNLPAPVVVAAAADASTTCPGGSVSGGAGATAVTLASGAQIPAAGSCTVTVSVTASAVGTFTNVIAAGDLQTDAGTNPDAATADLGVTETVSDTIFVDGFDGS